MNFLENYNEMTVSERKVLNYILNNKETIPYLKINELADATFVSKTVIINLAQKLGFSGYKELKYHLNSIVKEEKNQYNQELPFVDMLKDSVNKTFSLVSEKVLESCADKILLANNVFIMARGTSKVVGSYLEHLLLSIGIQCIFIKDYNLSETFTSFVKEDDVVIFISLSGNTEKVVETAKQVHLKKAGIINLTSFQSNTLASYSTDNLYVYTHTSDTKKNDKIPRVGFFIIIDLLIHHLSQKKMSQKI
ncbi:MAG TPA: MurR/RpiR family transcriptional regulator [Niallia sp.]|nr:MurR/RpiR family transcriptional regulator [Niallia sp.]